MNESLEWFKDVARTRGLKITSPGRGSEWYIIYWTSNEGYRHRLFYHQDDTISLNLDDDIRNTGDGVCDVKFTPEERHIFDKYIEMIFRRWP